MANDLEHFFHVLIAHITILIGQLSFYYDGFMHSGYKTLSHIKLQIFSPILYYFFNFLMVSFVALKNFLSFDLSLLLLYAFFFFFFYFILLYSSVLVLPYIDVNPPRVYMSSQS